ncbi:MAG: hypothetical protein EBU88_19560 [Acidobacteria bacterium]|nr:hypothetical protein [Acidobacteriota bacterium]
MLLPGASSIWVAAAQSAPYAQTIMIIIREENKGGSRQVKLSARSRYRVLPSRGQPSPEHAREEAQRGNCREKSPVCIESPLMSDCKLTASNHTRWYAQFEVSFSSFAPPSCTTK